MLASSMISIFPDELLLTIFREFHLTTIISARSVCREWRNLLIDITDIPTDRRAFLELYLQIIDEPWFIESRPWVLQNLSPFSRKLYVDALLDQHDYLPKQFTMWILEWPAKAAFGGMWPGLPPNIHDLVGPVGPAGRLVGWNLLDSAKPGIWAVNCIDDDGPNENGVAKYLARPLPGIPVLLESGNEVTWVLLDQGQYRNQVIRTVLSDHEFRSFGLNLEESQWNTWVDCLRGRIPYLRWLYKCAKNGSLPIVCSEELFYDPIRMSSALKLWSSCSRTPSTRLVDYIDPAEYPDDDFSDCC
ncbi:hypothetical protein ONZ45_g7990 [Pleurotus djamor]|nr:hypothetical protein ONZ45_g7990 [Pleurotus djamor]